MIRRVGLVIFFFISACIHKGSLSPKELACSTLEKVFLNKEMNHLAVPQDFSDFHESSFRDYCRKIIDSTDYVYNPEKWTEEEKTWMPSPASALMVGLLPQTQYSLPFVKQVEYKEVGDCHLGMRIYVKDLNELRSGKLKPLILFHGGAWVYRSMTGSFVIDALVPHFTEQGFIVFAPGYRTILDADGPKSCQKASGKDIHADVLDAYAWVKNSLPDFNISASSKVYVSGQSAGGYLALLLLTKYPQEIAKGLLFYPVTDLEYTFKATQKGGLYEELHSRAKVIYALAAGTDVYKKHEKEEYFFRDDPETQNFLRENSFTKIIQANPSNFPPVFVIQGTKDTMVPYQGTTRLCAAYDGKKLEDQHFSNDITPRPRTCGLQKTEVYFVDEGDHMLDLKCFANIFGTLLPDKFLWRLLCPAKPTSAGEAQEAMRQGFLFLAN